MKKYLDKENNKSFFSAHRKDICLAAAVLTAALVSGLAFRHDISKSRAGNAGGVLEVTIDGALYGSFPLKEDMETTITTSYGSNTVVIEQGRAYVKEADCPDKICAGMPRISQDGEMICCLPHRLFLTVRTEGDSGYDAIVY